MNITYLGTTMLLFDDGKDQILFDCHVSRPSLLTCLMGRFSTDQQTADRIIQDYQINRLRGIFISHTHHDHVMDAPYFASMCHADIYGSPSAMNVAKVGNICEENLHSYADSMKYDIGHFHIHPLTDRYFTNFLYLSPV